MTPRQKAVIHERLLAAVEDLRRQVDEGSIHVLAYAASSADGNTVVTGLTNGGVKPVTILGAVQVLAHRLIEVIAGGPQESYRTDAPDGEPSVDPDEQMN